MLAGGAFVIWANSTKPAMSTATDALQSDKYISVTQDTWIVFQPENSVANTGVIFYPDSNNLSSFYIPVFSIDGTEDGNLMS